jgi:predicted peptidase
MPIPGNMIVVCPQNYTGYFSPYQINLMINYLVKTYAIDTTRIYLTGFSAGGFNVLNYLTDKPEYAKRVAAAVPMSTLNLDATHFIQLRYLAEQNTRVKIFCGTADGFFANNKKYAYYISTLKTGIAEFVPYNGGHNGWFRIFSSTNNYYKPNMYEWMLRFSKK